MNSDQSKRLKLVKSAIELKGSLDDLEKELLVFPWDYIGEPVLLERVVLIDVLNRYLNGNLTSDDVHQWAEFLELRDDVDYPNSDRDLLGEVMHELATPLTEGYLKPEVAREYLARLNAPILRA